LRNEPNFGAQAREKKKKVHHRGREGTEKVESATTAQNSSVLSVSSVVNP
jgi:hypothetical protein